MCWYTVDSLTHKRGIAEESLPQILGWPIFPPPSKHFLSFLPKFSAFDLDCDMCIAFHSLLNRRVREAGGGGTADWILGMKPIAKSGGGDATVSSTTHELR